MQFHCFHCFGFHALELKITSLVPLVQSKNKFYHFVPQVQYNDPRMIWKDYLTVKSDKPLIYQVGQEKYAGVTNLFKDDNRYLIDPV